MLHLCSNHLQISGSVPPSSFGGSRAAAAAVPGVPSASLPPAAAGSATRPPRSLVLVALEQSRHQTRLLWEKLIQCEACGG